MTSDNLNHDIIVVGAGPGGSVAAKEAVDNGFKTCILEKERLGDGGRYKACGGACAWELIEEIDYPEEKISRIVESLELHHTDGDSFSKKGKGAVVWRSTFDKFLSDMAVQSGAILKEKEPLTHIQKRNGHYEIRTNKTKYSSKYVIAADGVTSPTLKQLDWPYFEKENLILTITKEMKTSEKRIEKSLGNDAVHLFFGIEDLIPIGYAWLFPKSEYITVGWGNQINLVNNSREEFKKYINLSFVQRALKGSVEKIFKPHLIPVGLRPLLYRNNVFAVGDSGGIVDPISGKGIPYAMMSGQIAIQSLKKCLDREKPQKLGKTYERTLDRKFLKILKAKRVARDRIFQDDETLKKFLSLWEKHRSSEIIMRKMI
jgi:geranylgeranyl reductase family protein